MTSDQTARRARVKQIAIGVACLVGVEALAVFWAAVIAVVLAVNNGMPTTSLFATLGVSLDVFIAHAPLVVNAWPPVNDLDDYALMSLYYTLAILTVLAGVRAFRARPVVDNGD